MFGVPWGSKASSLSRSITSEGLNDATTYVFAQHAEQDFVQVDGGCGVETYPGHFTSSLLRGIWKKFLSFAIFFV